MVRIGILALQGAFIEHRQMLEKIGATVFEIRSVNDLKDPFDGLVLPGGESTTMGRLLYDLNLFNPIKNLIKSNLPVLGTCAGAILLANHLTNDAHTYFQTMDITVYRNAYGRQLGSFKIAASYKDHGSVPMVFIRAPQIVSVGPNVHILATHDGHIVAAKEANQMVTTFHPELTEDETIHRDFLALCEHYHQQKNVG